MPFRHGIPLDRLVEMDAACGRHRIDGLFAEWPFLLPLLAPLREASSSSGDVSAALATVSAAQDTVPGLAAALVDLSARLRPVETFGAARYGEDRGGNDDHEEDEHYEDFEDPRAAFDAEYGRPGPERIGPAPRSVPGQPGEPSRVAVLLKRMRRKQVKPAPTSGLVPLLALAAAVPPDWLPGDAASYAAFAVVAGLFRPLVVDSAGALSLDVLVSSSKGRWPEFLARIGSVAAAGAVHDVKDMAAAFRRQVVAPALMHAMSRHAGSALDAPALHRLVVAAAQRAAADGNGRYWMMLEDAVWRLLFGGKAAPAVLEASARWHRDSRRMDMAIGTLRGSSWRVPFDRIAIAPGAALVAISDSVSLAEEGAALRHCVGGYAGRCRNRDCVIAAIRRVNHDGTEVSSSTVEFSGWKPNHRWTPEVLQHRGAVNGEPCGDDVHDLAIALEAMAGIDVRAGIGEDVDSPDRPLNEGFALGLLQESSMRCAMADETGYLSGATVARDDAGAAAGYDWRSARAVAAAMAQWRPFLARDVLAAGPEGFRAEAERAAGEAFAAPVAERIDAVVRRFRGLSTARVLRVAVPILGRRIAEQLWASWPWYVRPMDFPATLGKVAAVVFAAIYLTWSMATASRTTPIPPASTKPSPTVSTLTPVPMIAPAAASPSSPWHLASPGETALIGRLWAKAMAGERFCGPDGRRAAAGYPCAAVSDLLAVVDAETLSVYRAEGGRPPLWVFSADGNLARGSRVSWPAGRVWADWISDRLANGRTE